jgi:site-specific recombinase XerD
MLPRAATVSAMAALNWLRTAPMTNGNARKATVRFTGSSRSVSLPRLPMIMTGRHTAATLLLSAGVHPRVVMELLGHSQMRTTTDIYSHVMPALAREAADRMGQALWGE